jgi:hypothetical protein
MGEQEKGAFDIPVLSKDPENPNDDKPKHDATGDKAPAAGDKDVGEVTDMVSLYLLPLGSKLTNSRKKICN